MFNFLKNKISALWQGIGSRLKKLFGGDGDGKLQLDKLEQLLLENDVGFSLTKKLIDKVAAQKVDTAEELANLLSSELQQTLSQCIPADQAPKILLLVGVNGVGKTSFAAKFAHQLEQQGKKVLLVAADTFRAAAEEQLDSWAQKLGITICRGNPGQDPASVVFAGAEQFLQQRFDHLIIDTAGRLHTKSHLMLELEKIYKVLAKKLGADHQPATWLVLDAMLGQSSVNQTELFSSATKLDGLVLTKCDGSAKGGFVFAAAEKHQIPVVFTCSGQEVKDLSVFDPKTFIDQFLN